MAAQPAASPLRVAAAHPEETAVAPVAAAQTAAAAALQVTPAAGVCANWRGSRKILSNSSCCWRGLAEDGEAPVQGTPPPAILGKTAIAAWGERSRLRLQGGSRTA
ncbi:hypothetical protein cyc_08868 [Cyclospora cayetanensis]|uniref:Uncharacterized protein n=1 Tax=Cyclospora cayetanensis TaxID=88456 RepID=A0A1D3D413_9EIME|nr:hypothetical protein cyc_08868 [Cyclospora cayetanensis]